MPASILCDHCKMKTITSNDRTEPPKRVRIILPCAACVKRFGQKTGG